MKLGKKQLDYKWVILIVCFLMEFFCLGFCSSNDGLYTKAVTEALDIKRSVYSLATSFRNITRTVIALYFGTLVGKFGAKKMAVVGMLCLAASAAIRGMATNVVHIYIGSIVWGIGVVLSGGTMASTIVRRWFHKDVGRYTGIVMSANGIGGAIAAQIITPLINNGDPFGYRNAYWISALISLAISVVIILLLRENPNGGPAIQEKTEKSARKATSWEGLEYGQIKTKPYFYVTAVLVVLTGISMTSIGNVSIVHMGDVGLPAAYISVIATVSSLCLTFSKILVGMVYDKKGLRFTMAMCHISALISFACNILVSASISGKVLAMTASILDKIAMPLETVAIPLLTADMFGTKSYTKTLGIFMAMNTLGLCLGSPLADLFFDIFGTYIPCFWFFGGLMLVIVVSFQLVIRAAYKDRERMTVAC